MTAASPFRYAERRPAADLAPWIRNYWVLEVGPGAPATHHVPPDGCTALVHRLGTAPAMMILSGPWLVPLTVPISPGDRYAGIRLQPGAVGPIFGLDPTTLRDQAVPAHRLAPTLAAAVGGVLGAFDSITESSARLDALLLPESRHWATPDPLVREAIRHLTDSEGEKAIGELAHTLDVSPRTLRRRFVAATGLAPKQFARIRRLLAAAWRMAQGGESWSRVAAEAGFADQPHLTREMVDLTGLTPGAFGARVRSTEHDEVVP